MCIAPQVLQTGTYQYKDSQRLTVVYTSGSEVHTTDICAIGWQYPQYGDGGHSAAGSAQMITKS